MIPVYGGVYHITKICNTLNCKDILCLLHISSYYFAIFLPRSFCNLLTFFTIETIELEYKVDTVIKGSYTSADLDTQLV